MIKADEFLEKIKKENLKFNDKVEDVENAEDYKIFKIIQVETGKEEYFIFTKRTFNIFKIDYKYPVFI